MSLSREDQHLINSRTVITKDDLLSVADSIDAIAAANHLQSKERENEKDYDQRKNGRSSYITCFICGKQGHRSYECKHRGDRSNHGVGKDDGKPYQRQITCFNCGMQGHIASECVKSKDKLKDREVKAGDTLVNTIGSGSPNFKLAGMVNGIETIILLDTGADLTVVPDNLVLANQVSDKSVNVRGLGGIAFQAKLAKVLFTVQGLTFYKEVAMVSHTICSCVLLSVDDSCISLLEFCLQKGTAVMQPEGKQEPQIDVCPVITRSSTKQMIEKSNQDKEANNGATPLMLDLDTSVDECLDSVEQESSGEVVGLDGGNAEALSGHIDDGKSNAENENASEVMEYERRCMGTSEDEYDKLVYELGMPNVINSDECEQLKSDVLSDSTLSTCRALADKKERGYYWADGLLFHKQMIGDLGFLSRIVVPKSQRMKVLKLSHDFSGHTGAKRMRDLISRRFTWPNVAKDADTYVRSYLTCACVNKGGRV